ncbi:MAG: OmpH family outer membrane protein [Phycisphaeraceae bacterium]
MPGRYQRVSLFLAALLLAGLMTSPALAQKARPTAIAVVDVQKVFDSLQEKNQVEADLQSRANALKQEETDRRKKLDDLQKDLEMLAPGTTAHTQKQEDLERQAVELQAWQQFQNQKLQRERSLQIEGLYRKILDAIGRVAKEAGYDLVLFKEGAIDFKNANPQQLAALIQVRKVLWSAPDLDVTDQVTQRMNNEYKNR